MEKSKSVFRILLAHDLQKKMAPDTDRFLSGMDVVKAVINYIDKEVLVFIHSVNTSRAPVMADPLEKAGFRVTRIPMDKLKEQDLLDWVEDVRETWEDFLEEG